MKDIDFLPQKYREQHTQRRRQIWQGVVIVLYAGLLSAAAYVQHQRRQEVEQELLSAMTRNAAATKSVQHLTTLQTELEQLERQAELLTYLRHPWPRTRLLSATIGDLPESIVLEQLRIGRVDNPAQHAVSLRDRSRARPSPEEEKEDKRTPAERDLDTLRNEFDKVASQVTISGTSHDNAAVHAYLAQLRNCGLFGKVELVSIESLQKADQSGARFSARLTIRAGYGQANGPTIEPGKVARAD